MKIIRAMLIWILAFSLPIEGMAGVSMAHCKDMSLMASTAAAEAPGAHDHAAMMAMGGMSDEASMAGMSHAQPGASAEKTSDDIAHAACECGCKCSGDCVVACSGMMVSLLRVGFSMDGKAASVSTAIPHGQAHAAYRHALLRPPSAVAL